MGAEMKPEAKVTGGSGKYILNPEAAPVATVTGLYRGTWSGLEPLTKDTPLTMDEVRRNPIFYELELHPEAGDENLIIDVIYDNMAPVRLPDLLRDTDGRRVYPRAPGIHTVRIRTAKRKLSRMGKERDFSPANGGYTSPLFEFTITADGDDV